MHPSVRILGLAARIERLTVSHQDPHRFFEERSEIAAELRRIGRALPRPMRAVRPPMEDGR